MDWMYHKHGHYSKWSWTFDGLSFRLNIGITASILSFYEAGHGAVMAVIVE